MKICMYCKKEMKDRIYQGGSKKKFCSVLCRVSFYQKKNKDKFNARMKIYHSTDDSKFKNRVQSALRNAVHSGKIIKPNSCSLCSKESKIIHGHHRDYNKPFDVDWLCPKCHANVNVGNIVLL